MKTRAFLTLTILAFGLQACGDDTEPADGDAAAAPAEPAQVETPTAEPATPPNPSVQPLPDDPATAVPNTAAPAQALSRSPDPIEGEMPWNPEHTGIIDPGMTSAQVIATWGEPAAQRTQGDLTYLYFRNGCENSCGMFDLVILEGDQVVDAVLRGFGHDYSGISSSPANTTAVANTISDSNGV